MLQELKLEYKLKYFDGIGSWVLCVTKSFTLSGQLNSDVLCIHPDTPQGRKGKIVCTCSAKVLGSIARLLHMHIPNRSLKKSAKLLCVWSLMTQQQFHSEGLYKAVLVSHIT